MHTFTQIWGRQNANSKLTLALCANHPDCDMHTNVSQRKDACILVSTAIQLYTTLYTTLVSTAIQLYTTLVSTPYSYIHTTLVFTAIQLYTAGADHINMGNKQRILGPSLVYSVAFTDLQTPFDEADEIFILNECQQRSYQQ